MFKKDIFTIIESFPQKLWSLIEVKNYLRISHSYDDNLISSLIDAAIIAAENFTGLMLMLRSVNFICNSKNKQSFLLKYKPINKVGKITIEDDKKKQDLKDEEYYIDFDNYSLHLSKPLSMELLIVEYIVGFDELNVPKSIKHGILLHISEMYDRQEQTNGYIFSTEIKNLYSPYRQLRI